MPTEASGHTRHPQQSRYSSYRDSPYDYSPCTELSFTDAFAGLLAIIWEFAHLLILRVLYLIIWVLWVLVCPGNAHRDLDKPSTAIHEDVSPPKR